MNMTLMIISMQMSFILTDLADYLPEGVEVTNARKYCDDRGWLFVPPERLSVEGQVRSLVSSTHRKFARGLHYQRLNPQSHTVACIRGSVLDFGLDLRVTSPDFGKLFAVELSELNQKVVFWPKGFAHGFCNSSSRDDSMILYNVAGPYDASDERGVRLVSDDLGTGHLIGSYFMSSRDSQYPHFSNLQPGDLPRL